MHLIHACGERSNILLYVTSSYRKKRPFHERAVILEELLHPCTHALLAATSDQDARNADTFKEVPPGEPPSLVNPPTGCPHFMAGLCDEKAPPDFEPESGHLVACWLYQ